jgi:hypothetical protein
MSAPGRIQALIAAAPSAEQIRMSAPGRCHALMAPQRAARRQSQ